jgi:hypothetical protein
VGRDENRWRKEVTGHRIAYNSATDTRPGDRGLSVDRGIYPDHPCQPLPVVGILGHAASGSVHYMHGLVRDGLMGCYCH